MQSQSSNKNNDSGSHSPSPSVCVVYTQEQVVPDDAPPAKKRRRISKASNTLKNNSTTASLTLKEGTSKSTKLKQTQSSLIHNNNNNNNNKDFIRKEKSCIDVSLTTLGTSETLKSKAQQEFHLRQRNHEIEHGQNFDESVDNSTEMMNQNGFQDDNTFFFQNENNNQQQKFVVRNENEQSENNSFESLVNRLRDSESGISIQDRRYHLRTYSKCFKGSDCVSWMVDNGVTASRSEGVDLADKMMRFGLLHHVTYTQTFEDSETSYYRFINDDQDNVLNLKKLWDKSIIPNNTTESTFTSNKNKRNNTNNNNNNNNNNDSNTKTCVIAHRLLTQLLHILSQFINTDGSIDTERVRFHTEFSQWEEATSELQVVDLEVMKPGERMSFCINTYNMLCLHCQVVMGFPASKFKRWTFFQRACYQIGDATYSLDDIEHGLLRGNKSKPWSFFRQFGNNDERMRFVFPQGEPRIHFAISCGTPSDPPIRVYPCDVVGEALQDAAREYCDSEVEVNTTTREILLPRIFSWYSSDFGSSTKAILTYIAKFMSLEKSNTLLSLVDGQDYRIQYKPYHWQPFFRCFADGDGRDT